MTMMCVRCYLNGRRVPVGMRVDKNPPFAFMVYEGESRCVDHIPAPEGVEREQSLSLPEILPEVPIKREPIQTDNIYVVPDEPVAKKAPAKKAPQQRKRTKS